TEANLPVRVTASATGTVSTLELAADPAVKGRYTGTFPLPAAEDYAVRHEAGGEPLTATVRVLEASEELRHPNVNRAALQQLAGATKDVGGPNQGGRLVELPDLASIPDRLKGESKITEAHRQATVWDNWLTLALLIGIYS